MPLVIDLLVYKLVSNFAMSSSTGNGSITSGFYHARDGHLYTHENCALRTSRKAGNYGRRFLSYSQFNVRNNYIVVFKLN